MFLKNIFLKLAWFLNFILFVFSVKTTAQEKTCSFTDQKIIENMPPIRNQGSSSFCYGVAATHILQHRLCKQNNTNPCSNTLSALDALYWGNYGSGGLVAGGYPKKVLENIQYNTNRNFGTSGASLAKESCAPMEQILSNSEFVIKSDRGNLVSHSKWYHEIKNSHQLFQSCKEDEKRAVAKNLKDLLGLKASFEEVLSALYYKDLSIVFAKSLIPKTCESDRINIKPYNVRAKSVNNEIEIEKTLSEQINLQRPIVTAICANNNVEKECLGHALVISGIRKKCCQNICEAEYQIQDSGATFTTQQSSEPIWISKSILFERIMGFLKKSPQAENMVWLED